MTVPAPTSYPRCPTGRPRRGVRIDVTVSTPRHGKHAPAQSTVALRVPTAAERVDDLRGEVDGVAQPAGAQLCSSSVTAQSAGPGQRPLP
jgi:hypothetical protein